MNDEKKQELFPYFAYIYSQQLNPEKYGSTSSIEEWSNLIQQNPEDIDAITKAASEMSEEDWDGLEKQYSAQQGEKEQQEAIMAKKGAKLKQLQAYKKGAKSKKCECGCEMISKKEQGGTLVETCACGCKSKMQKGGSVEQAPEGKTVALKGKKLPKLKPKFITKKK